MVCFILVTLFVLSVLGDFKPSHLIARGGNNADTLVFINVTSPSGLSVTCGTSFNLGYNFNLQEAIYDSSNSLYIVGSVSLAAFGIYSYKNNSVWAYSIPAQQLNSWTAHNGYIYFIALAMGDNSQFYFGILNISNGIVEYTMNLSTTISGSPVTYKFGAPLVFIYDQNKWYTEVESINIRAMISFSKNSLPQYVGWMTGWTKLWYSSYCNKTVFGIQHGGFYSIDIITEESTLLFHVSCSDNLPESHIQMTVDYIQQMIYVIDGCKSPEVSLYIYDFYGNKQNTYNLPSINCRISFPQSGIQVLGPTIPGNTCPRGQVLPTQQNMDLVYEVIIGVAAGIIIFLLGIVYILCKSKNKSKRQGYIPIDGNQTLQNTLYASGGQIDASEIEINDLIGQGSFANVYSGIVHGTEVAIKVIKFVSMKDMQKSLLEEARIMVQLRHPHIVLFMGACIKMPDLFIVTEYMENGSIRELLDTKEVTIEEEHIRKLSIDACKGMIYLHSRKILHRDLKTHNLLVDSHWNVKVADFGLSRPITDQDGTMTACGTPSWAAPEVLRRHHYSLKADVYSFGICLWEICTRQRPYSHLKPYQVVISVATDGLRPDMETYKIPSYFETIMKLCWNDNPEERPDFPTVRDKLENIKCPAPKSAYPVYCKEKPKETRSLPANIDKIGNVRNSSSSREMKTRDKLF